MRVSAVFKWLHGATTIGLIIIVFGFLYLNNIQDRKSGDLLESYKQVNSSLWLYETSNSNGNATVPVVLRYYLVPKIAGTPSEIVSILHDKIPFLEGTGNISAIKSDNNQLRIAYNGRVYNIDPTVSYTENGNTKIVHISYEIK